MFSHTLRPLFATGPAAWARVRRLSHLGPATTSLSRRWPLSQRRWLAAMGAALAGLGLLRVAAMGSTRQPEMGTDGLRLRATSSAGTLAFEENVGQAYSGALFLSRDRSLTVLAYGTELVLRADTRPPLHLRLEGSAAGLPTGALRRPETAAYQMSALAEARTRVRTYEAVHYREVYRGVDLRLTREPLGVRLRFAVAPGTTADPIRLSLGNERPTHVEGGWSLGSSGLLVAGAPIACQRRGEKRVDVDVRLAVGHDGTLAFETGAYDVRWPLDIDVVIRAIDGVR